MVTGESSQKLFTYAEVVDLTGICVEHLRNFAKRRHLGFIAHAAGAASHADQRLFTPWDLTIVVTLCTRCSH